MLLGVDADLKHPLLHTLCRPRFPPTSKSCSNVSSRSFGRVSLPQPIIRLASGNDQEPNMLPPAWHRTTAHLAQSNVQELFKKDDSTQIRLYLGAANKLLMDINDEREVLISITIPLRSRIYLFLRNLKWRAKKFFGIEPKGMTFFEQCQYNAELLEQWKIERVKAPESLRQLLQQGWYLPFYFNEATMNSLASDIKIGNTSSADQYIMDTFDQGSVVELEKLTTRFPIRAKAIVTAFDAHRRGEYYLSIPVFFAQTEGICKEVVGSRFFSMKKGKPTTTSWASTHEQDDYINLLLKPLIEVGEARRIQEMGKPSGANRHDVLHGNSLDYGTKVNSYKAFSLLTYIGITIYELKEWLQRSENKREDH